MGDGTWAQAAGGTIRWQDGRAGAAKRRGLPAQKNDRRFFIEGAVLFGRAWRACDVGETCASFLVEGTIDLLNVEPRAVTRHGSGCC